MSNNYLDLPTANLEIEEKVPEDKAKKIADSIAFSVWGEKIACGVSFPVSDEKGEAVAHVFPYFCNSTRFPQHKEIFDEVERLRSENEKISQDQKHSKEDLKPNLSKFIGSFGSIYVSATKKGFPVIRISHFLHPYFLIGKVAKNQAKRYLKDENVKLKKYYFLGPHKEFFEFASKKNRILIHAKTLRPEKPEIVFASKPSLDSLKSKQEIKDVWKQIEDSKLSLIDVDEISQTHTLKLIANYELIPVINWTYWCVPTAYMMVFGFWDNAAKSKGYATIGGYGRLIDYWFEHPSSGNNVPNMLDEMIDPTLSPPTWRAGFNYDYNFSVQNQKATAANYWLWKTIKAIIDSGKPFVWSVPGGAVSRIDGKVVGGRHAMTAFGYHILNLFGHSFRFVVVYNTWGAINGVGDPSQQYDEYHYSYCDGIGRVLPGAGTNGDHAIIISPDGDETLQVSKQSQIVWYVWGNKIANTTISFSADGGNNWSTIVNALKTKIGWNSYTWTPNKTTQKARIRIQCYTNSKDLIAADGSQTNFKIS